MNVRETAPYLCVRDTSAAIAFHRDALGAEENLRLTEPSGRIGLTEIAICGLRRPFTPPFRPRTSALRARSRPDPAFPRSSTPREPGGDGSPLPGSTEPRRAYLRSPESPRPRLTGPWQVGR